MHNHKEKRGWTAAASETEHMKGGGCFRNGDNPCKGPHRRRCLAGNQACRTILVAPDLIRGLFSTEAAGRSRLRIKSGAAGSFGLPHAFNRTGRATMDELVKVRIARPVHFTHRPGPADHPAMQHRHPVGYGAHR